MSEEEIETRHNIWRATSEQEEYYAKKQTNLPKSLNLFGYEFNLDAMRKKGFLKPIFTIYLTIACCVIITINVIFIFGFNTNWDKIALFPVLLGVLIVQPVFFFELNQSLENELRQTKSQQIKMALIKMWIGNLQSFSVIYTAIFNTPFDNAVIFLSVNYISIFLICFLICLCGNYNMLPQNLLYNDNTNNNKIQGFGVGQNFSQTQLQNLGIQNTHVLNRSNSINLNTQNPRFANFQSGTNQMPNVSLQNYIARSNSSTTMTINPNLKIDEWAEFKQRLWTGFVTSIMYVDVISDIYYGYVLFRTYGTQSEFLRNSGIALMACCAADLMLVVFMLIFPGWVNHFAHVIAFAVEIPNFLLSGLAMWKTQQLINQNLVENYAGQQMGFFSVATTSLNALLHITYIADSWAVKSAMEFHSRQ